MKMPTIHVKGTLPIAAWMYVHEARPLMDKLRELEQCDQPDVQDVKADNYVAWAHYVHHDGEGVTTIHLCDSDADGAFKVYRRGTGPATQVVEDQATIINALLMDVGDKELERIEMMTDAELDIELRANGIDPEKMIQNVFQKVCVLAKTQAETIAALKAQVAADRDDFLDINRLAARASAPQMKEPKP